MDRRADAGDPVTLAALWLCATALARDTRRALTPPLRIVRIVRIGDTL